MKPSFIKEVKPNTDVSSSSAPTSGQCTGGCGDSCGTSSGGGGCAQSTGHSQRVEK